LSAAGASALGLGWLARVLPKVFAEVVAGEGFLACFPRAHTLPCVDLFLAGVCPLALWIAAWAEFDEQRG